MVNEEDRAGSWAARSFRFSADLLSRFPETFTRDWLVILCKALSILFIIYNSNRSNDGSAFGPFSFLMPAIPDALLPQAHPQPPERCGRKRRF